MKTSKQNSGSVKKQKIGTLAPKIQKFFKSAPKTFVIDDKPDGTIDDVKSYYIEALKEKLRGFNADAEQDELENENCTSSNKTALQEDGTCALVLTNQVFHDVNKASKVNNKKTANECNECAQKMIEAKEWENKYNEVKVYVEKYKALKKNYMKLTINFSETDAMYKDLLKTVSSTVLVDEVASGDQVFTVNEVKVLQSMPNDQKKDSNFILTALQYAYKSDPAVLRFKTLKGKPEWVEFTEEGEEIYHVGKIALTPEKVQRIKNLFIERVSKNNTDIASYGERIKDSNINKLFAAGIKNISKKSK